MDVKRRNFAPGIRFGSGSRFAILALICSSAMSPATARGQLVVPTAGNAAAVPAKAVQDEIRQSALRQLREGNLDQVLKILQVPAEWALPVSLVEDNSLAPVYAGLNRVLSQLDHEAQFELLQMVVRSFTEMIRRLTGLVDACTAGEVRSRWAASARNSFPFRRSVRFEIFSTTVSGGCRSKVKAG